MRFKIDFKIFLFLILFYFTKQVETYVMVLVFAFIHEIGHMLMGLLVGIKPNKMEIKPYGVSISFKPVVEDYNKKIYKGNKLQIKKLLIAIAGPATNFIIINIVMKLPIEIFSKMMIIYANLIIVIFNLIPIYPLDGGRILKAILHICLGKRKSETYSSNISLIFLILLTFVCSIAVYYMENIAVFIIVIFLWIIYIQEDTVRRRKNRIYNLIEKSLEIESNK